MTGKFTLVVLCLLGAPAIAATPDAAGTRARNLAANCSACHPAEGHGLSFIPRLRGTPAPELLQKLREFRSGARPATVMDQIVRGYTDEQLELIAAHLEKRP